MLIWIVILIFLICFTVYQWWFMASRFRNMTDVRKAKVKAYNRPLAWAIYSILLFLILVGLVGYQIFILMDAIMKLDI